MMIPSMLYERFGIPPFICVAIMKKVAGDMPTARGLRHNELRIEKTFDVPEIIGYYCKEKCLKDKEQEFKNVTSSNK